MLTSEEQEKLNNACPTLKDVRLGDKVKELEEGGGGDFFKFRQLTDAPSSYSSQGGKFVKVKMTEDGVEFGTDGGGAEAFTDLSDVPASYTGKKGSAPIVKGDESGIEFRNSLKVFKGHMFKCDTCGMVVVIDNDDYDPDTMEKPWHDGSVMTLMPVVRWKDSISQIKMTVLNQGNGGTPTMSGQDMVEYTGKD